ncbi:anti-sigma factor family protein [Kaarinaea lacus]
MDRHSKKVQHLFHAFLDGKLKDSVRVTFERYLQNYPDLSEELAKYQVIDQHIKETFEGVAQKPIPNRFTHLVKNYRPPKIKKENTHNSEKIKNYRILSQFPALNFVAIVCVALAGFIVGQKFPLSTQKSSLTTLATIEQLAIDAHQIYTIETRHAVEVGVTEKAHLLKWLSDRLETVAKPAQLDTHKLRLMGGRLLPSSGNYAAFYMYKDHQDNRLSLYMRKAGNIAPQSKVRCEQKAPDISICYWTGKNLVYFLIAPSPVDTLADTARTAYKQLKN